MGRYDDRLVIGSSGNRNCSNFFIGINGTKNLGDNNSYNKEEIYIGTSSGNKRVTRIREDYTVWGEKYVYGPLTQTNSTAHFCDCTVVSGSNVIYCGFKGWVYVNSSSSGDQVICQHTVGTQCYWKLLVTSSGQLKFQNRYNYSTIYTGYGKTMSKGAWHYVEVLTQRLYSGGTASYVYNQIDWNGWATFKTTTTGSTTRGFYGKYYQYSGKLQIGSSQVALKGTINVWGANGYNLFHNAFNIQDRPYGSAFGSVWIGSVTINGGNGVEQYRTTGTRWI